MQQTMEIPKPLRHFTKHLFLASKAHTEREKARQEVYGSLDRMRSSIIRMNLSYSDVDRLRQKIDSLVNCERKYAKFFRPEDEAKQELKNHVVALEDELSREREEKLRIMSEHDEKLKELMDSLENAKHKLRNLVLEKAKRQHRLKVLEEKISQKVGSRGYFHSYNGGSK